MVESNELVKKDFNIDRDSIPFDEQRKIFNELVKKRYSEFKDVGKRINPDDLIFKKKDDEIIWKDFRNYQNLIELFNDLRDCNINPKEVLKYQIKFKSDLGEMKKEIKIKIGRSNKCNTKFSKFFWFKRKKYKFFKRLFSFALWG